MLYERDYPTPEPEAADQSKHPTTGKPMLKNEDGTVSTEETITELVGGRWHNIPTIINGQRVSPEQAISALEAGKHKSVGDYATVQEAVAAARARSDVLGQAMKGGSLDAAAFEAQAGGTKGEKQPAKQPVTAGDLGMAAFDTLASLLKGATAASLGLPGDIESLVRLLTGGENVMPTTEGMEKKLPPVVPEGSDPRRKVTEKGATLVGEFLPVAPVGIAKAGVKAARGAMKGAKK